MHDVVSSFIDRQCIVVHVASATHRLCTGRVADTVSRPAGCLATFTVHAADAPVNDLMTCLIALVVRNVHRPQH